MEYFVDMTTHVPTGTPEETVDDIRGREAARERSRGGRRSVLRGRGLRRQAHGAARDVRALRPGVVALPHHAAARMDAAGGGPRQLAHDRVKARASESAAADNVPIPGKSRRYTRPG